MEITKISYGWQKKQKQVNWTVKKQVEFYNFCESSFPNFTFHVYF